MSREIYTTFDRPLLGPTDDAILKSIALNAQHEKSDLVFTAMMCGHISEVYAKNIGYLLLSLAHLTRFDLPASKEFLAKVSVQPPNVFDPAILAKTSLAKIIKTVETYLSDDNPNLLFPPLTHKMILQEFSYGERLLQETVALSMHTMNAYIEEKKRQFERGQCYDEKTLWCLGL